MYYNLNVIVTTFKSQILGPDPEDPTQAMEYRNTDAPVQVEWDSSFIPTVHFDPSRYPSLVVDSASTYTTPIPELPIVYPFAKNLQLNFIPTTRFLRMTFNTHEELENFTDDLVDCPTEFLAMLAINNPSYDYITFRFQEVDPTEVP